MIISSQKKFLFIHVPKTAGKSMTASLEPYQDAAAVALLRADVPMDTRENIRRDGRFPIHITLRGCGEIVNRNLGGYYRFAFVRNPWSRYLSLYQFFQKNETHQMHPRCMAVDFNAFINDVWCERVTFEADNQLSYIMDFRCVSGMSFIGRFEHLEEDYGKVCKAIGIENTLPHLNKTKTLDYREYYSAQSRNMIAKLCEFEISYFGYHF